MGKEDPSRTDGQCCATTAGRPFFLSFPQSHQPLNQHPEGGSLGPLGGHQMERRVCAQHHTYHLRFHRALRIHVASLVDYEVFQEVNALAGTSLRKSDDPKGEPWREQPHTQVRKGVAPCSSGPVTAASKDVRDLRTESSSGRPLQGTPCKYREELAGENQTPGAAESGICQYPEK